MYLLCDSLLLECDRDDEVYSLWMVYCYRTMSRGGMLQFISTVWKGWRGLHTLWMYSITGMSKCINCVTLYYYNDDGIYPLYVYYYSMTGVVRFTLQYDRNDKVYSTVCQGWWGLHCNMTGMMKLTLQYDKDDEVYITMSQGWCLHFSILRMMLFTL